MGAIDKELAKVRPVGHQPLVAVFVVFAFGMICDRYLPESFHVQHSVIWWWSASVFCWISWFLLWRRRVKFSAILLLLSIGLLGGAWHHLQWSMFEVNNIAHFARSERMPTCIQATLLCSPQRRLARSSNLLRAIPSEENTELLVRVTEIRDGESWRAASGVCRVYVAGHLLGMNSGDTVLLFGKLRRFSPPTNPGEFDFAAHAQADRLLCDVTCKSPDCVTLAQRSTSFSFQNMLDQVRRGAHRQLTEYLPKEQASLAAAMLLGLRNELPTEQAEMFRTTGHAHLLVVSGMHLGLVMLLFWFAHRWEWFPFKWSLAIVMASVVFYAALVDLHPPVTRAGTIIVIGCLAAWNGRRVLDLNSLAAAAVIVLTLNPADLFRAGTQLSFLAVIVLIWLGNKQWFNPTTDPLDKLVESARPSYQRAMTKAFRYCGSLVLISGAIWLVALPLVTYQFHMVSPIAVVAAPIVLTLFSFAVTSGFGLITVGAIFPILAVPLAWICNFALFHLSETINFSASLPGNHFWVPGPSWWWVCGIYLGAVIARVFFRRCSTRWHLIALAAWFCVGMIPALIKSSTRNELVCTFIDVGHGTSVLLEAPTGEVVLYDAGSISGPERATRTISAVLWSHGVMCIDAIIISHADVDHYNAVPGLLERFQVKGIYISPQMYQVAKEQSSNSGVIYLLDSAKQHNVLVRRIWAGDRLRVGKEMTLDVLHPQPTGSLGDDNANSVTVDIGFRGRSIILPGDLSSPGLEELLAQPPRSCDIVLAPHHGSPSSDPPEFAKWTSPKWVVVSGKATGSNRAMETYQQFGASVLMTSKLGAIEFRIDRDAIKVDHWLDSCDTH